MILSEKRVRDTPGARSSEAMLDFLLPGSRYAEREPIGLEQRHPRPRRASDSPTFYRDWYTPERSVVVVTGDVQPGGGRPIDRAPFRRASPQPADAPADPAHGRPGRTRPRRAAGQRSRPADQRLAQRRPAVRRPSRQPRQASASELRELLAGAMLQRRLESLGLQPGAPFSRAGAGVMRSGARGADRHGQLTDDPRDLARRPGRRRAGAAAGARPMASREPSSMRQLAIFRSQLQAAAARSRDPRSAGSRRPARRRDRRRRRLHLARRPISRSSPSSTTGLTPGRHRSGACAGSGPGASRRSSLPGPMQLADRARRRSWPPITRARPVPVSGAAERGDRCLRLHRFRPALGRGATDRRSPDLGITRVRSATASCSTSSRPRSRPDRSGSRSGSAAAASACPATSPASTCWPVARFVDGGLGRHSIDEINRILASRQVGSRSRASARAAST